MTLPQTIRSLEESYNRLAPRLGAPHFTYTRAEVGGIARLQALAESFATLTGAPTPATPTTRNVSTTAGTIAAAVKTTCEPAELSSLRAELASTTDPKRKFKLAMKIRNYDQ